MRELKFRAWNKKYKFFKFFTLVEMFRWVGIEYNIPENIPSRSYFDDQEEDLVFSQFTGLKDKNGKEIYEGDLIKFHETDTKKERLGFVSYLVNEFAGCQFSCLRFKDDVIGFVFSAEENFEIIGNIYENPGLLNA